MVNEALPVDMRDYTRVMDKKGIKATLRELATKHPEQYRDVAKALSDVGRDVSYSTGGHSFGLKHLRATPAVHMSRQRLNRRIRDIMANERWNEEQKEQKIVEATAAEHERLQKEVFPNLRLNLLHGRLKANEKEEIMAGFRDQQSDVLVSTTVVEVGVDIPNATVMMIEGANRFGLAQLHQLRGRVGRGGDQAYCLLLPETENSGENERLAAMTETNDGFILAERDLEHRGPGQFLGTRQSGFSELHMASLTDVRLIEKARKHAHDLLSGDPELNDPQHHKISHALEKLWEDGQGDIS